MGTQRFSSLNKSARKSPIEIELSQLQIENMKKFRGHEFNEQ